MIILAGGRVVDPTQGLDKVTDVVLEAGRVVQIGATTDPRFQGELVERIDVGGCWVMPGFVDLHTHLREPGHEYKEDIRSGLQAAAAGGFVTVCAMANTSPVNDTRSVTDFMLQCSAAANSARLIPFGAVTKGLKGEQLTEMGELRDAGALGVSDDGVCVMNASIMRNAMRYARNFDLIVSQHCEDHTLTAGAQMNEGPIAERLGLRGWPAAAEEIIVARDLILAESTGCRYHVAHLSTRGAVRLIREAKSRGLRVSAEVTPHHLMLTDAAVIGYNTHCKVNPPLRTDEDVAAIREALADGTIDCIATDHAPHSSLEKDCEFDAASVGINGLETAVSLVHQLVAEGALSPKRFVEVMSTVPAKLLPDYVGGTLKVGANADICVLDPNASYTLTPQNMRSKSHNSPWLQQSLRGQIRMTLRNGQRIYERGADA